MSKRKAKPKIGKKTARSQFEYEVWKGLKHELPKGAQLDYETEKLPYVIPGDYIPDFIITLKDGRKIYIEAKGNGRYFDQQVRAKMIAVKEAHPELDIRILFYSDGKIGPLRQDGTFRRQSDWAKKYNFPFAIREIPENWFE